MATSSARADVVVSTIDFNSQTPQGMLRLVDETGIRLTAADVNPGAVAPFGPFGPTDVTVGPNGDIYVADGFAATIFRFDGETGDPVPSTFPQTPDGVFTSYFSQPAGLTFSSLTFGPDGRLYVVDSLDANDSDEVATPGVRVYDPNTGLQVDTLMDDLGSVPPPAFLAALTFTPTGNLLVSDTFGSSVYNIDITTTPGSEVVTQLITGGDVDINNDETPDPFFPAGMAVDSAGDIYVANLGANSILKFDSTGGGSELVTIVKDGVPAEPNSLTGIPSHNPSDIVFDRDGNLLIAVLGDQNVLDGEGNPQATAGAILRYSTDGTLLQTVADGLLPTSGIALSVDFLPGDFNGDGGVDVVDYSLWEASFGESVTPTLDADANGDGMVDLLDYTLWRDTLGASGVVGDLNAGDANVPEPTSLLLATLGVAAWLCQPLRRV